MTEYQRQKAAEKKFGRDTMDLLNGMINKDEKFIMANELYYKDYLALLKPVSKLKDMTNASYPIDGRKNLLLALSVYKRKVNYLETLAIEKAIAHLI